MSVAFSSGWTVQRYSLMGKLVWLKYDLLWFLTWIPWRTNALYCSWFHWNFCSGYLKNYLKHPSIYFAIRWSIALSFQCSCFNFSLRIASQQFFARVKHILGPSSRLVYNVNFKKYSPIDSPYSCVQLTTLTRFRWTIWDNRTFDYNKVTGFN